MKHTEKKVEDYYHFKRECHKCGWVGYSLHCLHDGVQSDCGGCGKRLTHIDMDCDCEFEMEVPDVMKLLQDTREEVLEEIKEKVAKLKIEKEEREYYGDGHTTLTLGGSVANNTIDAVLRELDKLTKKK